MYVNGISLNWEIWSSLQIHSFTGSLKHWGNKSPCAQHDLWILVDHNINGICSKYRCGNKIKWYTWRAELWVTKERSTFFFRLEVTTNAHYELYLAPTAILTISFNFTKQFSIPQHNMITFQNFQLSRLRFNIL